MSILKDFAMSDEGQELAFDLIKIALVAGPELKRLVAKLTALTEMKPEEVQVLFEEARKRLADNDPANVPHGD